MVYPLLPSFSGLDDPKLLPLSIVGNLLFKYSESLNIDEISSKYPLCDVFVDVLGFNIDCAKVIELLNSGVKYLITEHENLIHEGIPKERLIIKSKTTGFANYLVASTEDITETPGNVKYFVDFRSGSQKLPESFKSSQLIIPILSSSQLTTDYEDTSLIPVGDFVKNLLTSDRPDGLITTIVTDTYDHALGLVYSNLKSIDEAIKTKTGVYQSRKRGLWYKGATSGDAQDLLKIDLDCDNDVLKVIVNQRGDGFCHLKTNSCFGNFKGLAKLQEVLQHRLSNAPEGSYTKRLFDDEKLLSAKIQEEADELIEAKLKQDIAFEAADLIYFSLVKCIKNGVSIADIEKSLDLKHLKVTRRKGDAKEKYLQKESTGSPSTAPAKAKEIPIDADSSIKLKVYDISNHSKAEVEKLMERPVQSTSNIMKLVNPIVENVINNGDKALLELTAKFDKVQLKSPILEAPFHPDLYKLPKDIKDALDLSIENVYKFHKAQLSTDTMTVETSPGVKCSRFSRPIERVGLYIPGGTAVLPSTALMLGVPANVAGCKDIIFASPPRKDGSLTPEVVYVAHKVGAKAIVLAGGAQAVAAMAYGTESVPKCDKILGPGNQFVTAAKMYVQNDTKALCSIDMPAGPSEVLVIADNSSDADFVAADLLSQAEHGIDSQVILIGVALTDENIANIQNAVDRQARELPREEIVRKCIDHSLILNVKDIKQAFEYSNIYAPEHLILQIENANQYLDLVDNAGSVFVGYLTPESCGDYSSGTNHTLPTYGYARMYSGVNTSTYLKFITSQEITETGLKNIGPAVMNIAAVEGLDAHRNAVKIRMEKLNLLK